MAWVLRSPQIHSTFGSLGHVQADGYHVNEHCYEALQTILQNILTEDKYLRLYRRSISFAQNLNRDLIPLLLNVKEDKITELLLRILVNLTIPVECLLDVGVIARTELGNQTVYEINKLLQSAKNAFADHRATNVVIDFLKKNLESVNGNLSTEQCTNIGNSLLLLRNILHIPEEESGNPNYNNAGSVHSAQNQILWNIFSQSIDKVLIKLMTIPEATNWAVTMVQLIALLYKDQHVATLQHLLNQWLETSVSQSSEDNESNTSQPDRGNSRDGSVNSSLMLTWDTSDSSESNSENRIAGVESLNCDDNSWGAAITPPPDADIPPYQSSANEHKEHPGNNKDNQTHGTTIVTNDKNIYVTGEEYTQNKKSQNTKEASDYGYGTQIEAQESISTSSNEDEVPFKKPIYQKSFHAKQKAKNKVGNVPLHDKKRKKFFKKGIFNKMMNIKRSQHETPPKDHISNILQEKTPSDDEISNILKEFTIDFLLNGYNSLVQTLLSQILTNLELKIDTSHFFWLIMYFLKFSTQIELDWEHISSVLSFEIVSYLAAEGVNLCEQIELATRLDGNDLKPTVRRLHLVVTAIRELIQAVEAYEKLPYLCNKGKDYLADLAFKISKNEELHSLFVLLLRLYNQKYYTKQYIQDVIVTNHMLLSFVDRVLKMHNSEDSKMIEHLRQFAAPKVMQQLGVLLEAYLDNGKFVNDCIFTLMHHVGGELGSLISLFQPRILTTFISIWKSEFNVCEDWTDLIEYAINTFIEKPQALRSLSPVRLETQCFEDLSPESSQQSPDSEGSDQGRWTEKELSYLTWNYMRCSNSPDVVTEIIEALKEKGYIKTRNAVILELYRQNLVNQDEYKALSQGRSKNGNKLKTVNLTKEMRDEEIQKLCEQLRFDEKSKALDWLQKVLLETCLAKIYFEKKDIKTLGTDGAQEKGSKVYSKIFGNNADELPLISSVAWLAFVYNQSVPLVPWNCDQTAISKDLKFLQLAHKLGLHMPVDTGKIFIRIPNFWTSELLYDVATMISPVDTANLKFSLSDLSGATYMSPPMAQDSQGIFMTTLENTTMVTCPPLSSTSFVAEPDETSSNCLGSVNKPQKISVDLEEFCETASVASDLSHMYVSDEDEKPEVRPAPRVRGRCSPDTDKGSITPMAKKRPRVQFARPYRTAQRTLLK